MVVMDLRKPFLRYQCGRYAKMPSLINHNASPHVTSREPSVAEGNIVPQAHHAEEKGEHGRHGLCVYPFYDTSVAVC
jgi:hypothetical protein